MTIGNGRRSSSATAYLRPALKRRNLTVNVLALTTRITIDAGRASGVEYRHNGAAHVARARREVILSSGVINTPQLLMLSGVGDPQELARQDIPVKAPVIGVGRNLQDHVSAILMYHPQGARTLFADNAVRSHRARLGKAYFFGKGSRPMYRAAG